ncbi:ribose-phosphate diphosphokinase [Candidatus Woesearchaeota archaeon]|nr:ribose-phosphate diphosphokinase [Candidatus Woesearchaeota archaeon]
MSKGIPLFVEAQDLEKVLENVLISSIRTRDEFTHKLVKWANNHLQGSGSKARIDHYNKVSNCRSYGNGEFCPTLYSEFKNQTPPQPQEIRKRVQDKSLYIVATSDLLLDSIGQIATPQEIVMRTVLQARAAKLSGARKVTVVLPLVPYSRQDPKEDELRTKYAGQADSLQLLTDMYKVAGVDEIITIHPHSDQMAVCCTKSGVRLSVLPHIPLYTHYLLFNSNWDLGDEGSNLVFGGPDKGSWKDVDELLRIKQFAKASGVYFDKFRQSPNDPNRLIATVHHVSKNFTTLEGKTLGFTDDVMDTCGTLRSAGSVIMEDGVDHGTKSRPKDIAVMVSHAVFSGPHYISAQQRLNFSGMKEVVFTNTVPTFEREQSTELKEIATVLRLASYFLNAIIAREQELSLSQVFSTERMLAEPTKFGRLYDIVRSSLKGV